MRYSVATSVTWAGPLWPLGRVSRGSQMRQALREEGVPGMQVVGEEEARCTSGKNGS